MTTKHLHHLADLSLFVPLFRVDHECLYLLLLADADNIIFPHSPFYVSHL